MTCGFYLAELVDRFVEDVLLHRDVYDLLTDTLRYLDADATTQVQLKIAAVEKADSDDQEVPEIGPNGGRTGLLLRYFELHLLTAVGYAPALQNCVSCAREITNQENGFRASLGGVVCPQCRHLWERSLSVNALKVLRYLQNNPWHEAGRVRLNPPLRAELEAVLYSLLRFHLERDLKSWSFLANFFVQV